LPPGCEAFDQSGDATSCFLDFACGSRPLDAVACGELASERWKCTCGQAVDGATFELVGATGADACVVGAGLCDRDDLEAEGDETCRAVYDDASVNGCSLTLSCGKALDVALPPGVSAWRTTEPNAHCRREKEGVPFACACSVDGGTTDYGIVAESGAAACRPLLDFCRSGADPVFDGETTCVDAFPSTTADSCSLLQDCATPMMLTDDVSLARVQVRNAWCARMQLGGSQCHCARPSLEGPATEVFQFEIASGPDDAACAAAMLDCEWDATITAVGDVSCEAEEPITDSNSCSSYSVCRQSASVDGRELTALSALVVDCERLGPGSAWACGCASGPRSTIVELSDTQLVSSEACGAGTGRCLQEIPLHLGPYAGEVTAPDPLPDPP
jgi:hypothetical protein